MRRSSIPNLLLGVLLLLPGTDEVGALITQYWPGMTIDDCLQCADDALYQGKKAGRDQTKARRP